jgi:hypothetical protein
MKVLAKVIFLALIFLVSNLTSRALADVIIGPNYQMTGPESYNDIIRFSGNGSVFIYNNLTTTNSIIVESMYTNLINMTLTGTNISYESVQNPTIKSTISLEGSTAINLTGPFNVWTQNSDYPGSLVINPGTTATITTSLLSINNNSRFYINQNSSLIINSNVFLSPNNTYFSLGQNSNLTINGRFTIYGDYTYKDESCDNNGCNFHFLSPVTVTNGLNVASGNIYFWNDLNVQGNFETILYPLTTYESKPVWIDFAQIPVNIDKGSFIISYDNHFVNLLIEDGVVLNILSPNHGFVLGLAEIPSQTPTGGINLVIGDGDDYQDLVTINAAHFFGIFNNSKVSIEKNDKLVVNLTESEGVFIIGDLNPNWGIGVHNTENDSVTPRISYSIEPSGRGGNLILTGHNIVDIRSKYVLFGAGSVVDIGLSTFYIYNTQSGGKTIFGDESTFIIERTDDASGMIAVSGLVTVEEGAEIIMKDGFSTAINNKNKTILTSQGLSDDTVFKNALFSFGIEGNNIVITGFNQKGVEQVVASAGNSTSFNYISASTIISKILNSNEATNNLKDDRSAKTPLEKKSLNMESGAFFFCRLQK